MAINWIPFVDCNVLDISPPRFSTANEDLSELVFLSLAPSSAFKDIVTQLNAFSTLAGSLL
jgi:hypothetical protein